MKKIIISLVVLVVAILVPTLVSQASVWKWELDPVFVYQNKFYSGVMASYREHKMKPVVIENQYGAYFRTEGLGDAVIEVYKTPGHWRDCSHNFSMGGAELFGQLILQDDFVYLPKGEYILKIVAGDNVSDIRMIFGPRLKP